MWTWVPQPSATSDPPLVEEPLRNGRLTYVDEGPRDAPVVAVLSARDAVVSGTAALLVVATGAATELGEISGTLRRRPPPAALEQGIHEFGMLLVRITMLLVLFVLLINLLFHRPLLDKVWRT